MDFLKEFLTGVSLGCVCVAGISFLFSRQKDPSTDEWEPKNIKEDLEEDMDEQFFDAETGSYKSVANENLNNVKQLKSIAELYMGAVEEQKFRDLQHNFELCKADCVAMKHHISEAIQTVQLAVNKQEITIKSLKLDMSAVKNDLNRLIESVDLLKTEMTFTERNTEKPDSCKLGRLKTRISILEREVAKNSSQMIGIDYTFLALLSTRLNSGVGAAVTSAEKIHFDRNPPNAYCHQSPTPSSSSITLAGPPPVHAVPRPPPPPPSITSCFAPPTPPPPPPPMMMKTSTPVVLSELEKQKCASQTAGPEKNSQKIYRRIPITEEILRSVVLKPVVRRP